MKVEQLKLLGTISLSVALVYFATAIIVFTNELSETRKALPSLISQIALIEKDVNLPEILNQVANIVETIPQIMLEVAEVRKQIPAILRQIDETLKQVPLVLLEVEKTRNMIPLILDEVSATREQIPIILDEVKHTRLLVPLILNESQALREDVPIIMVQANKLLEKAQTTATIVGENAVQGTIKGVIVSPYKLLKKSAGMFQIEADEE